MCWERCIVELYSVRKSHSRAGESFTSDWKLNRQKGCFSELANSLEVTDFFSICCSFGSRLPNHEDSACNILIEYEEMMNIQSSQIYSQNYLQFPIKGIRHNRIHDSVRYVGQNSILLKLQLQPNHKSQTCP